MENQEQTKTTDNKKQDKVCGCTAGYNQHTSPTDKKFFALNQLEIRTTYLA
jgi:hypothetical protein